MFVLTSRPRAPRIPSLAAFWASLALLAAMAAEAPAAASDRLLRAGFDDPTWSVALHMHASLSEGTGSMAWHADKAQQYGLDAIWWTDHGWRADHFNHTRRFDFETATVGSPGISVTEPDDAYPGEFRYLDRIKYGVASYAIDIVDTLAIEGTQSMRMEIADPYSGPTFRSFTFTQVASRRQNMYSLAARPHLRISVFPEALDVADARFFIDLTLSDHPTNTPHLRYVLGSMDEEPTESISLPFTPGQWNTYDLDLTADAIQLFTMGGVDTIEAEDNSLFAIDIGVDARNGATAILFVDDIGYDPDPARDAAVLMDWARTASSYYETIYPPTKHLIGTEISYFRAQPHMNGYAPSIEVADYTGHGWADTLYYAVDQVHEQGGVVSLNHMYGVGVYGDLGESEAMKAARILSKKNELIATRAYGVDVLEVGYRWRHGIQVAGHVDVWDALSGNAIFITGNGITDSHGSEPFYGWGPHVPGDPEHENNFVTWLHAPTIGETDLIHAMRSGRAYFGDPYEFGWNAEIDLATTDGFPMGRAVVTDLAGHDVAVEIVGLPVGADVRFLQGEIRENPPVPYRDVVWIRDELLTGAVAGSLFVDTVSVDTSLPSFVRVEVIDPTAGTIGYSNPIHFVHDVPAAGVAAARVAANVDGVRILDASGLTLLDVAASAVPPQFEITLDEDAPGIGTMELDVSIHQQPTQVTGAASWTYDAGYLSLAGFSGVGSTVSISWGGLSAPGAPITPREVTLAPGRPNPFGGGLVTEFALPDPAFATLEVLDVQGRRIRILLDERRDAGTHRVAWDGNDPYGRPVAGGVYFLRLRAGGRSLTTKAVKLR